MAKIVQHPLTTQYTTKLSRFLESANINFLIGSGASFPAMPLAGDIETTIDDLIKDDRTDEANLRKYEFLSKLQNVTNTILDNTLNTDVKSSIDNYSQLILAIEV